MRRCLLWVLGLAMGLGVVRAEAQVRVVKSADQKVTLSLAGLRTGTGPAARSFRETLEADLTRSGWFVLMPGGQAEFTIQGSCEDAGDGVRAVVRAYAAGDPRERLGKTYRSTDIRRLAHRAADDLIEALTGRKGMASSRLVVVGTPSGHKELYVADADGQNRNRLTRDNNICLAPTWSPDGREIVYTAYLKRFPDLFLIDVASGRRSIVAQHPGLNTGGAISPNGREMAMILSKDGNPELYVLNRASGQLTRLTTTLRANEASPCWSPDGNRIAYVSDQSGTPQLYILSRNGGKPTRISMRGSENVAPDWGPNGWIACASKVGGQYQVTVIHPDTLEARQISPSDASYEDPAWAPDGRHLACGRVVRYRSALYLLDMLGDAPCCLIDSTEGDWYAPAWSSK